ncbi:diacylglycerol kinase [Phaeobacter gallaeciensis]|uniref:diacylglycerol kinase n=1 Tax=Phaeobacter gallaeciensis TaxID=60890 RepID=UPI00237EFC17|nr:diacylglycerol kinase [Phaeobacter gallaeciensis]MDE4063178.1 diacylglycerol kinase [Phaeobacter gallaeciensis]MDE4126184.1 diacylglycerol kinase [Phaeobacter gallaeciensis]MDE4130650.1 diacylglycerol kinase [Phaeobacter gallaeciensis]
MTPRKSLPPTGTKEIPQPVTGAAHFLAATRYSLAGFRCLLGEAAARQELALGAIGFVLVLSLGASLMQVATFAILFALLLAVEALNTAIEVLTDRISPGWSLEAKQAKDLGSLAVALLIIANVTCFAVIVFTLSALGR